MPGALSDGSSCTRSGFVLRAGEESRKMVAKTARKSVAIIVPPKAQSLDVSGPLDAFLEANRHASGGPLYEVRLVAIGTGRTIKLGGMSLVADSSIFDDGRSIDTMLVAGTPDYAIAHDSTDFHAWLRRRAPKTRRYGSVCTGAFFLGASGLLDGMSATTHWQHAAELAERFPAAKVVPDQIYVQDGALYTSAGVTAGIDLALKLIEDDHGRDLALTVARRLVVFLKRPGGQSQFSAHLAAQMADEGKIRSLQHWILDHLSLDLSLVSLASRVAMSVRNLTRVFQDETGTTPADFVEMARVDAARRLLEESETPLQRVASRCGFGSLDTMRRAFLRRIGTGPSDYRERFRR
ncbi:GlxA family transcriptional regulator [Bradyrhizobium lablabi]|uniref:GlxA family transcriptional regulator n=1 Tax=Bradyrhizobium lablabi TaxID=722472 RepID=UPI001FCD444F|nr:helix-turn-helix domain-containing protein [Bradyrhizobium lablabi]